MKALRRLIPKPQMHEVESRYDVSSDASYDELAAEIVDEKTGQLLASLKFEATESAAVEVAPVWVEGGLASGVVAYAIRITKPLPSWAHVRCPKCGGDYVVRVDGQIRHHKCEPGAARHKRILTCLAGTRGEAEAIGNSEVERLERRVPRIM